MRRTFLAVVGFWLAVVTLVGLKSAAVAQRLGWSAEAPIVPEDVPIAEGEGGPGATVDPTAGALPSVPGATVGPTSGPTSGQAAPPSTGGGAPPPPPPPVSTTVTGAAIAVRTAQSPTAKSGSCRECEDYTVAVTITVSNGRITATSVAYNRSPGASQSYASSANNKLKSSILSAQKWNLGRVSGATYSGNAWELSVKDAMAKAGLPV